MDNDGPSEIIKTVKRQDAEGIAGSTVTSVIP